MDYVGNLIRPPSEAQSIILQVTVGCSYNKCTFCGAYKGTPFTVKPKTTVNQDIAFAKKYCRHQKRLFLADGDVLILKQNHLVALFRTIRHELPWVNRISLYGSGRAIARKKPDELLELKSLGLDRVYMGLESISPQQIAALTLMVLDNTPLGQDEQNGIFKMIGPTTILQELHTLVSHLNVKRSQFYANHASNYLPLSGRLPKDKNRILSEIELALAGQKTLVSEHLRAL